MTNVYDNDQLLDDRELPDEPRRGSHARAGAAGSGLPIRGLIMVLITVAILLVIWGVYSLTQKDDADANGAGASSTTVATAPTAANGAQAGGAASNALDPANPQDPAVVPAPADPAANPDAAVDGAPADAAQAEAGQAAPAADPAAVAATRINVLNNSTVPNLAETTYAELQAKGDNVGTHGNLPGEVATLPENTVFYQEGDAAGEQAAREMADRLQRDYGVTAVARPNIEGLPSDVMGNGQITLALIGPISF